MWIAVRRIATLGHLGAALWTSAACGGGASPAPQPEVVFAAQRTTGGAGETMQALLFGTLTLEGDCLRIANGAGGAHHVPIWPPGYTLARTAGGMDVLDETGRVRVRVGDLIRVSGGETATIDGIRILPEGVERDLRQRCAGPYWIVGNEVRPGGG
jgi:hypothetical protein